MEQGVNDYHQVKHILQWLNAHWRRQPDLEDLARGCAMPPQELHSLFKRWAGMTPKAFLQAITLDHAKKWLKSASVLETTYELGLSSPARLHDLFITHEALSPGEYKSGGAGLVMEYGIHASPFGWAILVTTQRGLAALAFADEGEQEKALQDLQARWPNAHLTYNKMTTTPYAQKIFNPNLWQKDQPLKIIMLGSDFEIRTWEALLKIPFAHTATYSDIAKKIENPKAVRAVGAVIGKNPLAFIVPCHRVLGKSGKLTGYHWGLTRKQAILGWEKAQAANS